MNTIKERPIVLTAQEVNAVLAGDKTQHRVPFDFEFIENVSSIQKVADEGGITTSELVTRCYHECIYDFECPLGAIGDRLWVQEPTLAIEDVGWIGPVFVASDNGRHAIDWGYGPSDDPAHIPACELTYNKSCDLSYEDSRLLLEITDIRIERVQDITLGDSLKEACNGPMDFAVDWMSKHGEGEWFINPWVWVIEFKVIKESNDG